MPLLDGVPGAGEAPGFDDLVDGLVGSRQPRLALCVLPLLLRWPARAGGLDPGDDAAGRELRILYTAAAASQALYRTRLRLAGVDPTTIPDRFSAELGLPPLDEMHGKLCLAAMDDLPSSWDGAGYRRRDAYRRIVELFLWERTARAPAR